VYNTTNVDHYHLRVYARFTTHCSVISTVVLVALHTFTPRYPLHTTVLRLPILIYPIYCTRLNYGLRVTRCLRYSTTLRWTVACTRTLTIRLPVETRLLTARTRTDPVCRRYRFTTRHLRIPFTCTRCSTLVTTRYDSPTPPPSCLPRYG